MAFYRFPADFKWGTASASYQIEGAHTEGGRGESIWDRFTRIPGNISDGTTGDIACDFYHGYKQDIALLRSLGMKVFRLSISWSRIFPDDTGKVNQEGIAFYRNVLTCLRENGIRSSVTIYHWDLPQRLQDKGGWANREIVGWFEQYAKTLFSELGDLVDEWTTLNEPYCTSIVGYWRGYQAPGYHDYSMALAAVHHLMLAHGTAVKAYRETGLTAEIGVVLNMQMAYPYNPEDTGDIEAAGRFHQQANNLFADPILKGCYPQEFFDYLQKQGVVLPAILPGDMELTSQPIDFLGLNTYFASYVRADKTQWPLHGSLCETGRPKTDANWEICPDAMYDLLCWIDKTYDRPKIIITENGTCMNDIINAEGKVEDYRRVDYIKRYLMNVKKAMDEGVNVAGYYVWSFTDNFEWAWGLSRRFGIVYVDYATQQRIPKQSALWFADVIKNNGFEVS